MTRLTNDEQFFMNNFAVFGPAITTVKKAFFYPAAAHVVAPLAIGLSSYSWMNTPKAVLAECAWNGRLGCCPGCAASHAVHCFASNCASHSSNDFFGVDRTFLATAKKTHLGVYGPGRMMMLQQADEQRLDQRVQLVWSRALEPFPCSPAYFIGNSPYRTDMAA